jgi:hypothetical protein
MLTPEYLASREPKAFGDLVERAEAKRRRREDRRRLAEHKARKNVAGIVEGDILTAVMGEGEATLMRVGYESLQGEEPNFFLYECDASGKPVGAIEIGRYSEETTSPEEESRTSPEPSSSRKPETPSIPTSWDLLRSSD